MLTYRVGSAGGLSGARAMTEHLMEPTLPPEMAQMAAYYACTPGASTMPAEADVSAMLSMRHHPMSDRAFVMARRARFRA